MQYVEYKKIVKADKQRYEEKNHIKLFLFNPCYRISIHYRRCKYLSTHKTLWLLYQLERYLYNRCCVKYGCDIPSHVDIGPGFRMDHPHGVVINSKAIIGSNFTIKSGAIIGANNHGVPVIGDNVLVGVHALIIGNIRIGNNVDIGAGAIIVHDVPENAVMVCDAAHILKIKDSQKVM